jgi:hypothetical protein
MTKRKLVPARALLVACEKADMLGVSGEVEQGDIQGILEAAAPRIAARALKNFADDFEQLGKDVGIAPHIYMQVAAVARRAAKDVRKGK